MKGDEILGVQLSGDFFATPKEAVFDLERKLEGAKLNEAELTRTVEGLYKSSRVEIPGITSGDFVQALLKIKASL